MWTLLNKNILYECHKPFWLVQISSSKSHLLTSCSKSTAEFAWTLFSIHLSLPKPEILVEQPFPISLEGSFGNVIIITFSCYLTNKQLFCMRIITHCRLSDSWYFLETTSFRSFLAVIFDSTVQCLNTKLSPQSSMLVQHQIITGSTDSHFD